jgi:hypothetical protein
MAQANAIAQMTMVDRVVFMFSVCWTAAPASSELKTLKPMNSSTATTTGSTAP